MVYTKRSHRLSTSYLLNYLVCSQNNFSNITEKIPPPKKKKKIEIKINKLKPDFGVCLMKSY